MGKTSKKFIIFAAAFIALLGSVSISHAEEETVLVQGHEKYVDMEDQAKGLILGVGPKLGFESNALKSVIGGAVAHLGYSFNKRYSLMLETDLLYTRNTKVNYLIIPVFPVLKVNFDSSFFVDIGGGYTYLWASRGLKFNSSVSTPSRSYNGWGVTAGAGYDLLITDTIYVSPLVGLDYIRIGSSNLFIPMAMATCNWVF